MKKLLFFTYTYHKLTELALDNEADELRKMNDIIKSDMLLDAFIEKRRKSNFNDTQLSECCAKIDQAEEYLIKFNAAINKCKENYRKTVAPHLAKINNDINDFTIKYNEENSAIEAAKKEIEEFNAFIQSEIFAIKSNVEKASVELTQCIMPRGTACETFMNGIFKEFQTVLG